ncbi:Activator of Hsp90 ATPase homolog 1-like protein [Filimonas lacunae]|uniref:Activator of Hsp90 ATPase homolog 1-like protein n=1 Tax=Filimonas lacunae TaxID=477680 RepID=A0A173MCK8_9BACT|nr:SRPBCC domain-containing protein [Filimonas lacunae]BAV05285.1 2-oxoglutarate dehydrogenase complex, dehydrogenase component [Filimonas lacunae]SIT22198.1 Activator of Hsp90 ATPase homolog 1-like protein [Filimonas lacunae]
MSKEQFTVNIHAKREKVWDILWNPATYPLWTAPFAAGSRAETDWKKGSKVLFLDAKGDGMIAQIVESIASEYMSIEHKGEIINGVEDTESERVKQWAGAQENYTLQSEGSDTRLLIEMDIAPEFAAMFNEKWPQALAKLKELAEA